jgi:hypothetical protein
MCSTYGRRALRKVKMLSPKTIAPERRRGVRSFTSGRKRQVEILPAVHQHHVDRLRGFPERLLGVTEADVHDVGQTRVGQVRAGGRVLSRLDLGTDHDAPAVVAHCRGEIDRGDPERGPVLDDGPGADRTGREVQEPSLLRTHGDVRVLHRLRRQDVPQALAAGEAGDESRRELEELPAVALRGGVQPVEGVADRPGVDARRVAHGCMPP